MTHRPDKREGENTTKTNIRYQLQHAAHLLELSEQQY